MKRSNLIWGIIFILGAVFVLLGQFTPLAPILSQIGIVKLLLTLLLLYWFFNSIPKLDFFGIFLPLAFLYVLYDDFLPLDGLTPWTVILAAIFLSIGLNFLFPRHHFHSSFHSSFDHESDYSQHISDDRIDCNVMFSGTTKYIDTASFTNAYFKCNFGSLKVFFDHATLSNEHAEIFLSLSFGEIELYLPKEWYTDIQVSCFAGEIKEIHKVMNSGTPIITLTGNVSFGELKIFYI